MVALRCVLRAGLCAALCCALGDRALAQAGSADPAEPPGYRATIDQALAEYQDLHFDEARALFARAHAIYPNARTLRGLGMVEFEQRNYARAADYLAQALASNVRPLEGHLRSATEDLLGRAKLFLAELDLDLQPPDTSVTLDGAPVELRPGTPVIVQVGDHVLEARAPGYLPEHRRLLIKGGERLSLAIALRAQEAEPDRTAPSAATDATGSPERERAANGSGGPGVWPWVVVGISGAAIVTGGVLVAVALSDVSSIEDAEKGTRWSEVADQNDGTAGMSAAGFALIGIGAAGLLTGLVWQALDRGDEAGASALQLQVAPDRVGVAGRF